MASVSLAGHTASQPVAQVPLIQYTDETSLHELLKTTQSPQLIKGFDIGPCRERWSPEYLHSVCDNRPVSAIVGQDPLLSFAPKNYEYKPIPLNELCLLCGGCSTKEFEGQHIYYYLRSLGDNPFKDVADLYSQLPQLSKDIFIPKVFSESQYFSSVLRLASAGLQLFTHYDIMDNILVQVWGRKRVALFNPRDSNNLYLRKEKSPIVDIDNPDLGRFPKFTGAVRWDCFLDPGTRFIVPIYYTSIQVPLCLL